MSDTKTDTSNPELLVKEKLDELVSFRNTTESMHEFWAKQYDLGLAWVHFPTGSGGLDLRYGSSYYCRIWNRRAKKQIS